MTDPVLGSSIEYTLLANGVPIVGTVTVAVTGPNSYVGTATTSHGNLRLTGLPVGDYEVTYNGITSTVPVYPSAAALGTLISTPATPDDSGDLTTSAVNGLIATALAALPADTDPVVTKSSIENVLYPTVYSWELQPGSDIPATCIGVLPKIDSTGQFDWYAGIVTATAGPGVPDGPTGAAWSLLPVGTALTVAAWQADGAGYYGTPNPAGVYIAFYHSGVPGEPPPYAFPAGWTPGNTTGSGPVLPYLGESFGTDYYAGLVLVEDGVEARYSGANYFGIAVPTTEASVAGVNAVASSQVPGGPAPGGLYLAIAYRTPGDPAPTAFPTGWTFRPYGLGQVAITDENAGGLIGDIAYVVSGWLYNQQILAIPYAKADPRYIGALVPGTYQAGDVFTTGSVTGETAKVFTQGGVIGEVTNIGYSGGGYVIENYEDFPGGNHYWPFIERYDLAAKKWLPRIPMPVIEGIISPFFIGEWNDSTAYAVLSVVSYQGTYYQCTAVTTQGDPPPPSAKWQIFTPAAPPPYAAEGGIAGVIGGKLYFGGGDGGTIAGNEFFSYDPATGLFERLADVPDFGAGNSGRS